MRAYLQAAWDDSPDTKIYIAAVHRLSDLGGVVTHVAHGISQDGFDAEWRDIHILTVEGDTLSRSELFDESDIDAALTTFDELTRPTRQLENTASRVTGRFYAYFAVRDWAAMTDMVADGFYGTDRRLVVNADLDGRDAVIESFRAAAYSARRDVNRHCDPWRAPRPRSSQILAQRPGPRCVPRRSSIRRRSRRRGSSRSSCLTSATLTRCSPSLTPNTSPAKGHRTHTRGRLWRGLRRVQPTRATAHDVGRAEHRSTGEGVRWANLGHALELRADKGLTPHLRSTSRKCIGSALLEQSSLSAAGATSPEGFEAEWRADRPLDGRRRADEPQRGVRGVGPRRRNRDIRPATRPARPLENTASQVWQRLNAYFSSGDWTAMSQAVAPNMIDDDRRRTVNGGVRRGRNIQIANGKAVAATGTDKMTSTVIAIRGGRLALCRSSFFVGDQQPGTFRIEFLSVVEIDVDEQVVAHVGFDIDNIDVAFEELDARYVAGEAAEDAHTWSVICPGMPELPAMAATAPAWSTSTIVGLHDCVRRVDPTTTIGRRANIRSYVEAVHRLTDLRSRHQVGAWDVDGGV